MGYRQTRATIDAGRGAYLSASSVEVRPNTEIAPGRVVTAGMDFRDGDVLFVANRNGASGRVEVGSDIPVNRVSLVDDNGSLKLNVFFATTLRRV